jgi:hypothetical protein
MNEVSRAKIFDLGRRHLSCQALPFLEVGRTIHLVRIHRDYPPICIVIYLWISLRINIYPVNKVYS